MTRAFNIEGLVRLQNYMGGKTLSDAQFFAVLNANVVEMVDGEESTTKRRYFRIAENDESITFSCILGSSQQQMVVTKATKQLDVTTAEIGGGIAPGSITTEMLADGVVTSDKLADGAVTSEKLAPGLDVSGLFFILPAGTQLPYTLTEEDKTKIAAATFIVYDQGDGEWIAAIRTSIMSDEVNGAWISFTSSDHYTSLSIIKGVITQITKNNNIVAPNAVMFTPQALTAGQKTQARTNIGAAEDPNTSGDTQATLEEPPVVDEEPIP